MTRTQIWLVGVAMVGLAASLAAAGLCWVLVTRPVAFAHYVQQVL
jgi:hypothetical protein